MNSLFEFSLPPWELIARGSLMFWFLFFLFRFALRRDAGSFGLADILLIVLIADAAQNGMAGDYKSVSDGVLLISTIAGWNYLINWLSFHSPRFAKFAEPRTLVLVRHGQIFRENLAKELLTEEELRSQLRQAGVEDIRQVRRALLESDGHISVIRYDDEPTRMKPGIPGGR